MDIPVADVPVGRFFATADKPPGNVFIMLAHGRVKKPVRLTIDERGRRLRYLDGKFASKPLVGDNVSLCQNIDDERYWHIRNDLLVRLIREDEQDQTVFHVHAGRAG